MAITTRKSALNMVPRPMIFTKTLEPRTDKRIPKNYFNGVLCLIDKVKRLAMLPRPLRPVVAWELQKALLRLKAKFTERAEVERFCLELARRRCPEAGLTSNELVCESECGICKEALQAGSKALFSAKVEKHICLSCLLDPEYVF